MHARLLALLVTVLALLGCDDPIALVTSDVGTPPSGDAATGLPDGALPADAQLLADAAEPSDAELISDAEVQATDAGVATEDSGGVGPGSCLPAPATAGPASPDDGNVPANAFDGDPKTRFSSQGIGSYITADLGEVKSVCKVGIAWYQGDKRANHFTLGISEDGTSYQTVFSGDSSGTTAALEEYGLSVAVPGRYVRITVNGNTANDWASMTEIVVYAGDVPASDAGTGSPADAGSQADAGMAADSGAAASCSTAPVAMACPSAAAISLATSATKIWFDRNLSGGAHTWIFNGAEFVKAATAFCGDTQLDAKLLEQIRYLLEPARGFTAPGGFANQKQVGAGAMFTLARYTPRIWNQLTAAEQQKITVMMQGLLVSSAWTMSDANPFVVAKTQQRAIDGDTNVGRDWNPNYRNGFIGGIVVSAVFMGGGAQAQAFLTSFDHAAFVQALQANQLDNLYATFVTVTTYSATRPTAAQIETAVRGFAYYGLSVTDLMGLYLHVTNYTYSKNVSCGLNNGQGIVDVNGVRGGYMKNTANCASLPHQGQVGMLMEFDSLDANGARSSAHYANDGWYVNNYVRYVLVALGQWERTVASSSAVALAAIGTEDLAFKISPDASKGGGYFDYSKGKASSTALVDTDHDHGYAVNFDVARILADYHERCP